MGTIPPKAHRRLVPRVPKKEPTADLDVTVQRTILVDDSSDDLPVAPRELPTGSVDQRTDEMPDESMEMTAVRTNFIPSGVDSPDDDLEMELTSQRVIDAPAYDSLGDPIESLSDPPIDDFYDDASETSAHMPRHGLARMLAGGGTPHFDHVADHLADAPIDANAFSDSEPTSLKVTHGLTDAEDRPTTHISPAERGLLAAMSEGHEASRLVYVKWLEKRGEVVRAEFLKLDCALAQISHEDPRHAPTRRRLLELAPRISIDWRSRVARSLIEGCTTTTGRCPAYWRSLPADSDDVRGCGVCGDSVYYCVSIDLARSRRASGHRVAVDLTVERFHGDLEIVACANCRQQVPPATRFCPHCGQAQR